MRRYLIIFAAIFFAILVFFVTFFLIKKITQKKSYFYPSVFGLIAFILILISSFAYLEKNSGKIDLIYKPPHIVNDKIIDGGFKKD